LKAPNGLNVSYLQLLGREYGRAVISGFERHVTGHVCVTELKVTTRDQTSTWLPVRRVWNVKHLKPTTQMGTPGYPKVIGVCF
jgi:hypothetical protein